jgi:glycogen debranching enzyme
VTRSARDIARGSLLANVRVVDGRPVLTAGARHFCMVWTRDFCFSAGGLIAAGRADALRETLALILSHQRADGLLPRLLDTGSWALRVALGALGRDLPLEGELKPNYIGEHGTPAIDGNALVCWAAERCAAASGDAAFAAGALPALARALAFYDARLEDGLVTQPPYSDWQDSIRHRRGRVFFTSLIYWRAHESLAALSALAGADAGPWRARAEALKARIFAHFWDEGAGAFTNIERGGPLSSDGLLFSVVWGFTDPDASRRLLRALDAAGAWTPWGPRCATPDYPSAGRGWITKLAGIPDYHDRVVWLWQTALAARAFDITGDAERAAAMRAALTTILQRDGASGEVYEPDTGLPVKRRLYRSEAPFSWSSAMALEALDKISVT